MFNFRGMDKLWYTLHQLSYTGIYLAGMGISLKNKKKNANYDCTKGFNGLTFPFTGFLTLHPLLSDLLAGL